MAMEHHTTIPWIDHTLQDPSGMRESKPRTLGITMVMDKGLGLAAFSDLLQAGGAYIDFIKLGFGTSVLYPPQILREKIRLAKLFDVQIYPGGTFFEVAHHQGKAIEYFREMKRIGFDALEISEGTVSLSRQERSALIQQAREYGFTVLTECGKKLAGTSIDQEELLTTLEEDLHCGALYMIVEGRESGENVGVYDERGKLKPFLFQSLEEWNERNRSLIWEAPKKQQQVEFIDTFGYQVNLGNIASEDVFSLEALRRGLRSDTFILNAE